jgi:hypothetical protein
MPTLTEPRRRIVFATLVAAQDRGMTTPKSREYVGWRFRLRPEQVRAIEREGLRLLWPPLSGDRAG